MSIFSLKEIEVVKGKQKFYKLVKDGTCEFDEFEAEARINYDLEMTRILSLMERVSTLKSLTKDQFKDITPSAK